MGADTRRRRREWMLAAIGVWIVRVLGRTWRVRVRHDGALRRARADGTPIIFTLWHGHLLPLLYHHRGEGVAVLISEHADGEIIAQVASRLGYRTVRGSTSRGAARALLGLVRVIGEGRDLAITPDGPRGPAKSFAPGPSIVALRSGAPILAVGVWASSAWRLKSWDAFLIPRPFARVHIAYGDLTYIETSDVRDAPAETARLREEMDVAEQRASG